MNKNTLYSYKMYVTPCHFSPIMFKHKYKKFNSCLNYFLWEQAWYWEQHKDAV